jgi:hypothetical protein
MRQAACLDGRKGFAGYLIHAKGRVIVDALPDDILNG